MLIRLILCLCQLPILHSPFLVPTGGRRKHSTRPGDLQAVVGKARCGSRTDLPPPGTFTEVDLDRRGLRILYYYVGQQCEEKGGLLCWVCGLVVDGLVGWLVIGWVCWCLNGKLFGCLVDW